MSHPHADRNLLLGILAMQMDFVSRDALIAAMNAWVLNKARSLGEVLQEQGALVSDTRSLLDALVDKHLSLHGDDPARSLAALSSIASAREDLRHVPDAEVQASLAHVAAAPDTRNPNADPYATRSFVAGESTSVGARFRILRPHAKGGLGEVFIASDEELHREVALKEIQGRHAHHPDSRARFLMEAEITGGLEHPGIVPVYGLGTYADGRPFYAMRFIRGDSLQQAVERFHRAEVPNRDPGERILALRGLLRRFIDVCNAVAYAHSRGILHRDLKPGNIMLGPYGETLVVDWGLAKPIGRAECNTDTGEATLRPSGSGDSNQTRMGEAIGTPAYMPPEQAAGQISLLGPASDVYSLGATLYHLLTGQAPFQGNDAGSVLQKVQQGDFSPPRQINALAPPALEVVCLKAMRIEATSRYQSPRELADDVEHWLADEPVSAYRESRWMQLSRWGRRHRTLVTSAAVLTVTAVIALTAGIILLGQKQVEVVRERNAAREARDHAQSLGKFYEDHVLAAARPKGWSGGAGKDITLKEALDQAVPKIDEAFVDQPEREAAVRHTLGMTYFYLGRFESAAPFLKKAHTLRLDTLGPEHPDVLTSLDSLAMVRWKQDKTQEAIALAHEVLQTRQLTLGDEHQETLWAQLHLVDYLYSDNQFEEAERLVREAIDRCERQLGNSHHQTAYGYHDLALILNTKRQYDQAVALDRKALQGRRNSLGPDHPETLRSMHNLAWSLRNAGNLDEAESQFRQALKVQQRVLGSDHMETLWSESGLGNLLAERGSFDEAESLLRSCFETQRRVLGPEHSDTLERGLSYLAALLEKRGKTDEAEKLYREMLATQRRRLPASHPDISYALINLGSLLSDTGRPAEAEPLLRECLLIREQHLDPGNWRIATARSILGICFARQKKFASAEPLVVSSYEAIVKDAKAPPKRIAESFGRLIELYETWGKPEKTELWKKKRPADGK